MGSGRAAKPDPGLASASPRDGPLRRGLVEQDGRTRTRRSLVASGFAASAGLAFAGCAHLRRPVPGGAASSTTDTSAITVTADLSLMESGISGAPSPWFESWLRRFNQTRGSATATSAASLAATVGAVDSNTFEAATFGVPATLPARALDLTSLSREQNLPVPRGLGTVGRSFQGFVVAKDRGSFAPTGGLFALPLLWHNLCVAINVDLAGALGLSVPTALARIANLQEFLVEAEQAIRANDARVTALDAYGASTPAVFQAVVHAAGGTFGEDAVIELSTANSAALLSYADLVSHCRPGALAQGTAVVGFLWTGGSAPQLQSQVPAGSACQLLPFPDAAHRLRYAWGPQIRAATGEAQRATAFSFLEWCAEPANLQVLSAVLGLPAAIPGVPASVWRAAFPKLSGTDVLSDPTGQSAFLDPLMATSYVQVWLQLQVIPMARAKADVPYSSSEVPVAYQTLVSGIPALNEQILGTYAGGA